MEEAYAVVIVVDSLRADALGAYGNAQAETPFLDRLAAKSVLYDFAFSLDPAVDSYYSSFVLGVHPAYRHLGAGVQHRDHARTLVDVGSHFFVTDDPAIGEEFAARRVWSDTLTVPVIESHDAEVRDGVFASAAQWLGDRFRDRASEPRIGWIHVSLPRFGGPIESRLDYDTLVTRFDEGLRTLFAELSFPESSRVLCIVTAARGYSLGERGRLGTQCSVLHEEFVHVPLIVHAMGQDIQPRRINRLTSPIDLGALVANWLEELSGEKPRADDSSRGLTPLTRPAGRASADYLFFASSQGDRALRTPGWYLVRRAPGEDESPVEKNESGPLQLFLKPDDRWEFNEVSNLRPDIANMLAGHLDALEGQAISGEPLSLPALPDELLKGS